MGKIEDRLAELGYELPVAGVPKGNYVNVVRTGDYIYTAGHLPVTPAGELITGKVGKDLTTEEGYAAAQRVALALLATLKKELGELDHIKRVVKLTGFVNCVDTFTAQPGVINGASDTVAEIFGDKGKHARSAVGTNALPLNVAVEIEAVVEVETGAPSLS
ncbi:Endoribonuclease L-PSP [Phytophthora palmivora]|uniref:Endoribonuclease L-PSP n=1 Tax=Phytophthora palmivora TaxID=4796 RepID=A0A2P4XLL7_9STRA|nr:Endoribonuclease L-PSP [Phytophthora palmivora]POM78642.1 Endoribonuclease L-PSP [Phytophthora palmivora]